MMTAAGVAVGGAFKRPLRRVRWKAGGVVSDARRLSQLNKEIRQAAEKMAGTPEARRIANLGNEHRHISRKFGKRALKVGAIAASLEAGRRAAKAAWAQVHKKPQYRQYDVYPNNKFSVQGGTQFRQPYYDSEFGGYETPPFSRQKNEVLERAKQFIKRTNRVFEDQ